MKILLIDDSEIDNYINRSIILKSSMVTQVDTVTSGEEGLEYLEKEERFPDIIFLDIRMPLMDGYEFMEHFKKFPDTDAKKKCRIFVLSSSIDPVDIARSESYEEIEKHLAKPLGHHSIDDIILDAE